MSDQKTHHFFVMHVGQGQLSSESPHNYFWVMHTEWGQGAVSHRTTHHFWVMRVEWGQ